MFDAFPIRALAAAVLCLTAFVPAVAQDQLKSIEISAGAAFKHKHSKLAIPATIDGIARTQLRSYVDDQLDVIVNYENADVSESLSIYIYRDVAAALPVWFDRARWAIEGRDSYGTPRLLDTRLTFAPPGRQAETGLIAVYATSKGPFRSTGVALVPLGEWLVKVRYSSTAHTPEVLAEKIRGVLAQLKWPGKLADAPVALPVIPCADALAASEPSKPVSSDGASVLMGAMFVIPISEKQDGVAKARQWCRDDSVEPKGNVYRAAGAADAYLIALSDAGRGISVQPDYAASLLDKQVKPAWTIRFLDLARTVTFASQDRLTPPNQAIEIFQGGKYLSEVSTWGKKRSVNINSDAFKE